MRNLTLLLMLSRHFKKHDSTWRVPTNSFRCLTLMSIMNRALDWQESYNQRTRFRANSVLSHGNRVPTHTISLLCVTQKTTGLLTLRMAAYSGISREILKSTNKPSIDFLSTERSHGTLISPCFTRTSVTFSSHILGHLRALTWNLVLFLSTCNDMEAINDV